VTAPARPECEFFGIVDDGIAGFAWDPERPYLPLEVELLHDGQLAGKARADLSHPDLAARGIHTPHAFLCRLNRLPSLPCEIVGRVTGVAGTFGTLRIGAIDELARAIHPSLRYEGHVDELVRGKARIYGWVIDRFNPDARVRVTLRDWNEPLLEVKADHCRPTLAEAGRGDGCCAFDIRLPVELLDGKQHTLRITVEDTNVALSGCPVNFEPYMARELVEVIAPWREDVLRIESALPRLNQLLELEAKRKTTSVAKKIKSVFSRFGRATKPKLTSSE
jgi:hypothetical protein